MTTKSGTACGGYFLLAEICRINTFPDHLIDPDPVCCKEEIVYSNRSDGFSGGDTIEANLFDDCYKFLVNNKQENLNIQLRSFREKKVEVTPMTRSIRNLGK